MSLIEEAARRLEQLRKSGVDVPMPNAATASSTAPVNAVDERAPMPERLMDALQSAAPTGGVAPSAAPTQRTGQPVAPGSASGRSSRLVQIDLAALAAAGYVTPEAQRLRIGDEFRVLKRPIIRNAHGTSGPKIERGNRVMVTSALPREGKSFVSLNLAMSIASEVDSTVLLIDADVANPSLMKRLRLPEGKGLLDLLGDDRIAPADVMLRTNVEKLSLLPAGTMHGHATEMLASEAMAKLVDQMSARYPDRILIFDSPPLLATTEARVLASHMGQVVMVVEADHTSRLAVKQALDALENCPVVLMVLNKASPSAVGSYYGYNYGYGYGQGYGYGRRNAAT